MANAMQSLHSSGGYVFVTWISASCHACTAPSHLVHGSKSHLHFWAFPAESAYQFSALTNDWGFTQFANQAEVYANNSSFCISDTLRFNVIVRIEKQEEHNYDSKKATGYVGLKNQGATCYMNSLLQTLYNINYFRQVPCAGLQCLPA